MRRTLFVSDLHLAAERPAACAAFAALLEREAGRAERLYVLGDLFEYWIGDDDLGDPLAAAVARGLAAAAARGTAIRVMHGNRDFLLGARFCAAAGAEAIADPHVTTLGDRRALLMHGDVLCTDDHDYQAWRRTARSDAWQREFLAQPLEVRRERILELRARSRAAIMEKPAAIMDVNAQAVQAALRTAGTDLLIHGHTHKPARHALEVDGRACERWVLPEWYGRGGYLVADAGGLRLEAL